MAANSIGTPAGEGDTGRGQAGHGIWQQQHLRGAVSPFEFAMGEAATDPIRISIARSIFTVDRILWSYDELIITRTNRSGNKFRHLGK
jgi:hypothetical protein